ncbi:MAG: hypothetical protein ACTTKM_02305 [Prevotella fusca]|uniref:hypothetical protein n=1 Tax=Prevotella fusca TaxID=589436 RepID=UPI003F9EEAE7
MRHCLSLFVLISLLNLSSVAGREMGSYDTLKVLCPNDSCKTDITVSELMEYSWDKKACPKDSSCKVHQLENIHQYNVMPVFKFLVRKSGKALNLKADNIEYSCLHTRLKAARLNEKDSVCDSYFVIERIVFPSSQERVSNYFKTKINNKLLKVGVVSEAPVSCFTYWRGNALIIVWYNFFDDEKLIKKSVETYLRNLE